MKILYTLRKIKFFTILVLGVLLFTQYGSLAWADDTGSDGPSTIQGLIKDNINYLDPNDACTQNSATPTTSDSDTSSGPIYILGDSITVRTASAYEQALGKNTIVDGLSGRSLNGPGGPESTDGTDPSNHNLDDGMKAISDDKSEISQASAIVVALGTNGGDDSSSISAAIKAIQSEASSSSVPIYWINTFGLKGSAFGSEGMGAANTAIDAGATSNGYTVIDWAKTVDPSINPESPGQGGQDSNGYISTATVDLGVHPTPAGQTALANLVETSLGQSGGSTSATGTSSSCSCSTPGSTASTTALTGSDNAQEVWNFFKQQGFSDAQAAGIMGNLYVESAGTFNPEIVEGGSTSADPASISPATGYGIAQWYSDDIEGDLQSNHVAGTVTELSTQLNLIMAELNNGTEPYEASSSTLGTIKSMTDAVQVATYWDNNFEGGTDPQGTGPGPTNAGPGGVRENAAQSILQKYGGTGGTSTNPSTGNCTQTDTGSVNCTTANGNVKILCEAEQWKGIYYYYGGGHESLSDFKQSCPDLSSPPNNQPSGKLAIDGSSGNPSPCAVDCSGLVDLSTDMAFSSQGVDMGGASVGGIQSSKYWKSISFSDLQPGDIVTDVTSTDEHTEIVDTYDSSSEALVTFGAHYTTTEDGTIPSTTSAWTGAYRYIGPGSNSS